MKRIYTQTFSDERVRVDNTIDNYFESIVNSEKSSADDKENLSPEELIKLFKERNPDGWYKVLETAMQHEMQHDTKKPGKTGQNKKRETGFEPAAPTLARWCSTTEPLAH